MHHMARGEEEPTVRKSLTVATTSSLPLRSSLFKDDYVPEAARFALTIASRCETLFSRRHGGDQPKHFYSDRFGGAG